MSLTFIKLKSDFVNTVENKPSAWFNMHMINPLTVLLVIVFMATLLMFGINIYLMTQSRKKKEEPDEKYLVLNQRFDALSQVLNDQLHKSRESTERATATVSQLINEQLERSRQSSERATLTVHQQVQSFTQNMTQLQENMKQMHESVKNVSSFQDIFKSPKLRGIWGESSLEGALNQYFSKDMYSLQHYFKSGEAVDAVLRLPNNLLLPIDSKFNWENFEKMVNAETDINKEIYRKQFYGDVKKKIDEISSKYLLPSESTTDLALMYVPAETVYYEIINNIKDVDIPNYARQKKVFLVSPNTFALSVSAIRHWVKDVEFSKQTKDIMKRLERISTDGGKLAEDFGKLGKHIDNVKSAYDSSEKRLSLMVDRVKNVIEIDSKEEPPKIEAPVV
ncbi:DNA recombination protein RmuC [Candidatus Parcubacteria bacterium]|nr:DNA recombination protein RmuC [Candidatus Parcubacteria bacterium]